MGKYGIMGKKGKGKDLDETDDRDHTSVCMFDRADRVHWGTRK